MIRNKIAAALSALLLLSACQTAAEPDSSSAAPKSSSASSPSVSTVSSSVPERSSSSQASATSSTTAEESSSVPMSSTPEQDASEPPVVSRPPEDFFVLAEKADGISILMEVEQERYPSDTKTVGLEITNGSEQEISCDEYFVLEKKEDDRWNRVRFKDSAVFQDIALIVAPGQTAVMSAHMNLFAQPLSAGEYRIKKDISGPEAAFELMAEFTLGAPERPLELEKPKAIRFSMGEEGQRSEVTFSLKQKYEGKSTVSYTMDQLEGFVPLPENTIADTQDGRTALLVLVYPDGMQRELFVQTATLTQEGEQVPATLLIDGRQTYCSYDEKVLERLAACAEQLSADARGER